MQSKWKVCQFICNAQKHTYIYINKFKLRASIANIKRTRVLKNLTLEIKANLNNIAWLSQLEVCNVCQYVCNARNVRNMHTYENKTLQDVPGLTRPKFVRWKKMATLVVRITMNQPCRYG